MTYRDTLTPEQWAHAANLARDLGYTFATADYAAHIPRRNLDSWGDHDDLPLFADLFTDTTGIPYPEVLEDSWSDAFDRISDAFESGYAEYWDEAESFLSQLPPTP